LSTGFSVLCPFIFTLFEGFVNNFHVQKGLRGKEFGKH
jgi:hypothetical protein